MNLAKLTERRPQFLHQRVRLLEGGEVTALREPVVVDELGIGSFRPTARSLVEFVREGADGNRGPNADRLEEVNIVFLDAEARRGARQRLPVKPRDGVFGGRWVLVRDGDVKMLSRLRKPCRFEL